MQSFHPPYQTMGASAGVDRVIGTEAVVSGFNVQQDAPASASAPNQPPAQDDPQLQSSRDAPTSRSNNPAPSSDDYDPNDPLVSQTLNADGTPKRPMNAFMIFARKRRPELGAQHAQLRTGEISKLLSKEWSTMTSADKAYYQDQARKLKDHFNSKYPDYVYRRRPNNTRKRRRSGERGVGCEPSGCDERDDRSGSADSEIDGCSGSPDGETGFPLGNLPTPDPHAAYRLPPGHAYSAPAAINTPPGSGMGAEISERTPRGGGGGGGGGWPVPPLTIGGRYLRSHSHTGTSGSGTGAAYLDDRYGDGSYSASPTSPTSTVSGYNATGPSRPSTAAGGSSGYSSAPSPVTSGSYSSSSRPGTATGQSGYPGTSPSFAPAYPQSLFGASNGHSANPQSPYATHGRAWAANSPTASTPGAFTFNGSSGGYPGAPNSGANGGSYPSQGSYDIRGTYDGPRPSRASSHGSASGAGYGGAGAGAFDMRTGQAPTDLYALSANGGPGMYAPRVLPPLGPDLPVGGEPAFGAMSGAALSSHSANYGAGYGQQWARTIQPKAE